MTPAVRSTAEAALPPASVSDGEFAASVHRLLRDGTASPARSSLLAGVVARALGHANERFAAHQEERGLATVTGALYLSRAGEFRTEMAASVPDAVRAGALAVSKRGDEGRALALMSLQKALLSPGSPEAKDIDGHLAALRTWVQDTAGGGSVDALGAAERIAVSRALLDPSVEATNEARNAVLRWIEGAIRFHEQHVAGGQRASREEAVEAFRAIRSGAQTLAALHLRSGDANSAYSELSGPALAKVRPPALYDHLDAAANGGDGAAWRDLLVWLWAPQRQRDERDSDFADAAELAIDPTLHRAALWGTAIEAYRRDPTQLDVGMALATLLASYGLAEAAPLVLADGVTGNPSHAKLSSALRFVLQVVAHEDEAEDPASARRVFGAAEPLLQLTSRPEYRGQLEPSPARLRRMMAAIETRAGDLAAARRLLESATAVEPSADGWTSLAAIDRQAGKLSNALVDLNRALEAPEAKQNPLAAGEARFMSFEIQRQMGALDRARSELSQALTVALNARKALPKPAAKARAERLLARVLDRFSDPAGASRALQRAYAAAADDKHELTATVLDTGARALLLGDVVAARTAVDRALAASLDDDNIVYLALWLQLLERGRKDASDGTAARALASIRDDGQWTGRLASWGLGKTKDADLIASARTPGQKTEAAFYVALARKATGDAAAARAGLMEVSKSAAIELIEVQLARDMVIGPDRNLTGPPPVAAP